MWHALQSENHQYDLHLLPLSLIHQLYILLHAESVTYIFYTNNLMKLDIILNVIYVNYNNNVCQVLYKVRDEQIRTNHGNIPD